MKTRILYLAFLLTCGSASAGTIEILLDATTITGSPGEQITFTGRIINNETSVVDLNSIQVTLDGLFSVDVGPFFLGPVSVDASTSLVPGQTVGFEMFSVLVNAPYTDPFGFKTGIVTILGGVEGPGGYDPSTQDILGSAVFSVNVAAPEPSTLAMVVVALLFVVRRAVL